MARIIIMLIKLLIVLSIIGIVASIINIFIKSVSVLTFTIAQAICNKSVEVNVSFKIQLFILLISVITLTCVIIS